MKVVEVRVLFRAPRFAQMGFAWRRHVEAIWVERVRRSSQSADGLADQCGTFVSLEVLHFPNKNTLGHLLT
jgi:hypothetical protein